MPDGKRKRRWTKGMARRKWYAKHRAIRFNKRFGLN